MDSPTAADIWCKICGVTAAAQAVEIAAAGANAIGINFYPQSARYTELEPASEITSSVSCQRIGVFVDATSEAIEATLKRCELDLLQFHGDESVADCERWGMPYIKALRVRKQTSISTLREAFPSAWAFLLDTFVPGQHGGTGRRFDWSLWPADGQDGRLILAGGLDANNVAEGVETVAPFGVDVAGGVEFDSRTKDIAAVARFIHAAKHAGQPHITGESSA